VSQLVSIIVPCYNAARWLGATLESALAQTWPHLEILVVDDGSADNSLVIARQYECDRLRVVTQPNAGAAAARNTGLRLAQGNFIQFLDADDLLAADKIASQMAVLIREPAGTIASGPWGAFTTDQHQAAFRTEPVWRDFTPFDWLITAYAGAWMFPPLVWLSPRAVLDAAGPWNETLSLDDDGEYFCRVLLQASSVRFCPQARSYYRRHDGPRVSTSRGQRAAQSSFTSNVEKERRIRAIEDSPRVRHALACNWQRFAWEQITEAPALAAQALSRVHELDPSLPAPTGTRLYGLAASVLGWKTARRLQLAAHRAFRR
jgi:glycosyltransferase involved in cell wall biosynthesis